MLLSVFLTCFAALVLTTALLLVLGHRIRFSSRILGALLAVITAVAAGEIVGAVWHVPPRYVLGAEVFLVVMTLLVVAVRDVWNPIGQVFYGCLLASVVTYLAFAGWVTFAGGLSAAGMAASALLLVLELVALVLTASFAFESIDMVCRTKWQRSIPKPDPNHRPFVSLHIAAYNEPPDMLIETIKSVEAIDYDPFEIVVIDNNTKDQAVWQPVYEYCKNRKRVRFVHVDELEGYKSGALNLVLSEYTDPRAEIVGVIDADYLVDPEYLKSMVGYFAEPSVAFVQSPQDYRDWEGDTYMTACYDAYKYFFSTTMPSRNDRNSIIFAGTMGLLRKSALEGLGGWDEWCITEDAETSLRLLMRGYEGIYVPQSFGRGIMPLTFAALKSQRFRWCFGGMQILRRHWRDLMPWNRDPNNQMTLAQRLDYLLGGVQWLNDLAYFGFTVVLVASAWLLITQGSIQLRPLYGAAVLLPAALIVSGLLRAIWALRHRTGIGLKRAVLAFVNWLSMSWTVAVATVQGLILRQGVFMRTPKSSEHSRRLSALWSARTESLVAAAVWGSGIVVILKGVGTWFLLTLLGWQGFVYASAPYMAWMNARTQLSPELERRRATEWLREGRGLRLAFLAGAAAGLVALAVMATVVTFGGSHPGTNVRNPFALPKQTGSTSPIGSVIGGGSSSPAPVTPGSATVIPSVTATPTLSPTPTPTASPTTSPTP